MLATVHAMFKPIPDYPDYAINEQGEIMSYKHTSKGRLMRGSTNPKGYISVALYKHKQPPTMIRINRLVAQVFIPNPDNLPEVNHIDKNKTNNQVSNLEWCNRQYNSEYSLSKYYLVEHISSGDTFTVFNLEKWCRDNNLNACNLNATFNPNSGRKSAKGYRVLSVSEHPIDDVT